MKAGTATQARLRERKGQARDITKKNKKRSFLAANRDEKTGDPIGVVKFGDIFLFGQCKAQGADQKKNSDQKEKACVLRIFGSKKKSRHVRDVSLSCPPGIEGGTHRWPQKKNSHRKGRREKEETPQRALGKLRSYKVGEENLGDEKIRHSHR